MKRKFLMEEDDGKPSPIYSKFDAIGEGLKEGADKGTKVFLWFFILFLCAMAYLIVTF